MIDDKQNGLAKTEGSIAPTTSNKPTRRSKRNTPAANPTPDTAHAEEAARSVASPLSAAVDRAHEVREQLLGERDRIVQESAATLAIEFNNMPADMLLQTAEYLGAMQEGRGTVPDPFQALLDSVAALSTASAPAEIES